MKLGKSMWLRYSKFYSQAYKTTNLVHYKRNRRRAKTVKWEKKNGLTDCDVCDERKHAHVSARERSHTRANEI